MSSQSRDYSEMVHLNKNRFYNQLSQRQNNNFRFSVDCGGGSGPRITHFSFPKGDFGRCRHNLEFKPSYRYCTSSSMVSSFGNYYLVCNSVGYTFS